MTDNPQIVLWTSADNPKEQLVWRNGIVTAIHDGVHHTERAERIFNSLASEPIEPYMVRVPAVIFDDDKKDFFPREAAEEMAKIVGVVPTTYFAGWDGYHVFSFYRVFRGPDRQRLIAENLYDYLKKFKFDRGCEIDVRTGEIIVTVRFRPEHAKNI